MNRLILLSCTLAACSFSKDIPDAGLPEVFVGFQEAASTADEKSKMFPVNVQLSDITSVDVTVKYQIEPGPGVDPGDFKLITSEVVIPAGQQSAPLYFDIETDTIEEGDEHIDITLVEPENAQLVLGSARHDLTIRAKALPRVSFEQAASQAQEPADATFNVKLDEASAFAISAAYTVTSTSAVSGADYVLAEGTVEFAAGELVKPLVLDVLDDALDEDNENVVVTLTTATNSLVDTAAAAHTHTILDDLVDPPPTVQFSAATAAHGEADGAVTIGVTLGAPSGRTISIPYSVAAASTATAAVDYTIPAGPLTIAPGATTGTITVTIVQDTADEPNENVIVDMGTAVNAQNTGVQQHRLQIDDDDQICYGTAPFSVCLDAPPTNAVTLPATINTTNAGICATTQPANWIAAPQNQPAACFVIANTITSTNTTVVGTRPLVLLAHTSIAITGTLDASSNTLAGSTGPASPGTCAAFVQAPGNSASGGGGGAGGSFLTAGGNGGTGDNGATGAGVALAASGVPTTLRAGCDGQRGGNGSNGAGGGNASGGIGHGGGAVYLVTAGTLQLGAASEIDASGGAGGDGNIFSGGSGAGSGGMIRLHAGTLMAAAGATVRANGGAGARGGDAASGAGGASGGAGFANATAADAGDNAIADEGGGGGGGGGGLIQSNQTLTNVTASAGVIQQ